MAVVTPASHPQAPPQIGSWVLLQELQRHPAQWLYKARHCSVERVALLKVLPPETARDQSMRAQFLLEARIAAANPGRLLQAYDVFEWESCLAAVMEWPRGEVLSKFPQPVEVARSAAICLDVAYALTTMHREGVIHGALRSSAVLVGSGAEAWRPMAKLLDLGLCLPTGQDPSAVHGAGSLGPENARGAPVDAKSDVYGLGALCVELLTGRVWRADAEASLPARTPDRLVDLLRRCLAVDPTHRPASMAAVADELEWVRYELVWGHFGTLEGRGAPQGDADFGEHAGWFIEDGDTLTEDQVVSLVGYARPRARSWAALSFLAVTLVAGAVIYAGVVLGLSPYVQ